MRISGWFLFLGLQLFAGDAPRPVSAVQGRLLTSAARRPQLALTKTVPENDILSSSSTPPEDDEHVAAKPQGTGLRGIIKDFELDEEESDELADHHRSPVMKLLQVLDGRRVGWRVFLAPSTMLQYIQALSLNNAGGGGTVSPLAEEEAKEPSASPGAGPMLVGDTGVEAQAKSNSTQPGAGPMEVPFQMPKWVQYLQALCSTSNTVGGETVSLLADLAGEKAKEMAEAEAKKSAEATAKESAKPGAGPTLVGNTGVEAEAKSKKSAQPGAGPMEVPFEIPKWVTGGGAGGPGGGPGGHGPGGPVGGYGAPGMGIGGPGGRGPGGYPRGLPNGRPPLAQMVISSCAWFLLVAITALFYWNTKKDPPPSPASHDATPGSEAELLKWHCDAGDFRYHLLEPVEDLGICCLACWCPFIRWADTIRMLGFLQFWVGLAVVLGLSLLSPFTGGLGGIALLCVFIVYRQKFREFFGLPHGNCGTVTSDCCAYMCCTCCAIVQEARMVEHAYALNYPPEVKKLRICAPPSEQAGSA